MQDPTYRVSQQELENCAKEPIHLTPLVQDHGLLLACDRESGQIEFASANVEQYFGRTAPQMLGTYIAQYVNMEAELLMRRLRGVPAGSPVLLDLPFRTSQSQSDRFEVMAHRSAERVVLECMPFVRGTDEEEDYAQLESLVAGMGTLHHNKELPEFLKQCATQIRHLCGYQRVIIYRFLPDWSGEVLAESVSPSQETRFLGLRFPASDIPVQARALYRINLMRVIGDVLAEPVPVVALHPGQVLDQSHSLLRSPSPMHLGYLRNMGTRATMTISLLHDGELWGMVSCHHNQPRTPPAQLRRSTKLLCSLVAATATVRIDAMVQKNLTVRGVILRNALNQLASVMNGPGDLGKLLELAMQELLPVLQVQDYGVLMGGKLLHSPDVSPQLLNYFNAKAQALGPGEGLFSNCITTDPQCPADALGRWAGVALVPLPGEPHSYLLLLREEVTQQVRWAGAPSTSTEVLPSGLRVLGPRESFATWVQMVRGHSVEWGDYEESACREIAKCIADVSAWHRTQRLQSELNMLGSCMARLNDMVVVTDTNGIDEPGPRIVYVNDAFVASTGYTREEVIGRSPRFLQGANTGRSARDTLRAAMAAWKPVTVELVNYKKDGSPYWAEIAIAPIADTTGSYTHWVAIERNISERKQVEHSLQASQSRLVEAQVVANMGSWETDLASLNVIWSAQTYKIFDLDPQTFQGSHQAFLAFVHPQDRAAVDAAFLKSFEHTHWDSVEHRIISAAGVTKHVQERWRIERDDQGTPVRAVGTCQDITELKLVLEAQERIADRLALATRAGGVGTWDFDIVGNKVVWDGAMYALYGIAVDQFGGAYEAWRKGVHPDDQARGDEEIQRAIRGEKEFDFEFRVVWPDGTVRNIRAIAMVHRDGDGRALRMIGTNWDITSQTRYEENQRALLREKNALLKEVHHRVKNNLQVIASLLRLEAARSAAVATKTVLRDMNSRIYAMAQLHESLYRSGTFASVDLGAYLGRLATQAFKAQAMQLEMVQLKLSMDSLRVGMDQATAAGLVLNELISNCLKHGFPERRPGEITVELKPARDPAQQAAGVWCLNVGDTGVGLPPDFNERREASLGMQLVSDLSVQLGGKLVIDSLPGQGARFSVVFTAEVPAALVMPE